MVFSVTEALQLRIKDFNLNIPYQFLKILPRLIALFALLGLAEKVEQPKALGVAYYRESRN